MSKNKKSAVVGVTSAIAGLVAGSVIGLGGSASADSALGSASSAGIGRAAYDPGWSRMLPKSLRKPCNTEDSVNCYWYAPGRGNGKGHSYVVREFPGHKHLVCVMYVNRRYAKHHDYCA